MKAMKLIFYLTFIVVYFFETYHAILSSIYFFISLACKFVKLCFFTFF